MSNNFLGCVLAIPIVLAIIGAIIAGEMWLIGQAIGVFGYEITRWQSFILVSAISVFCGSPRRAVESARKRP